MASSLGEAVNLSLAAVAGMGVWPMTVESTQAGRPSEREGTRPPRGPDRHRPIRRDAIVPLAAIALGCAAPVLGLLVLPQIACSGEHFGESGAWCFIGMVYLAPVVTGLIAGGIAGALRPTWLRLAGGLGGLAVGYLAVWSSHVIGTSRRTALELSIAGAVAFAVGYAVGSTIRWLIGTVIRKVGRTDG